VDRAGSHQDVVDGDDVVRGQVDVVVRVGVAISGVHDGAANGEGLPGVRAVGDLHVRDLKVGGGGGHLHLGRGELHVVVLVRLQNRVERVDEDPEVVAALGEGRAVRLRGGDRGGDVVVLGAGAGERGRRGEVEGDVGEGDHRVVGEEDRDRRVLRRSGPLVGHVEAHLDVAAEVGRDRTGHRVHRQVGRWQGHGRGDQVVGGLGVGRAVGDLGEDPAHRPAAVGDGDDHARRRVGPGSGGEELGGVVAAADEEVAGVHELVGGEIHLVVDGGGVLVAEVLDERAHVALEGAAGAIAGGRAGADQVLDVARAGEVEAGLERGADHRAVAGPAARPAARAAGGEVQAASPGGVLESDRAEHRRPGSGGAAVEEVELPVDALVEHELEAHRVGRVGTVADAVEALPLDGAGAIGGDAVGLVADGAGHEGEVGPPGGDHPEGRGAARQLERRPGVGHAHSHVDRAVRGDVHVIVGGVVEAEGEADRDQGIDILALREGDRRAPCERRKGRGAVAALVLGTRHAREGGGEGGERQDGVAHRSLFAKAASELPVCGGPAEGGWAEAFYRQAT
jgi:hypothetical protein